MKKMLLVMAVAVLASVVSVPSLRGDSMRQMPLSSDLQSSAARFDGGDPAPTCDPADPKCKIPGGFKMGSHEPSF